MFPSSESFVYEFMTSWGFEVSRLLSYRMLSGIWAFCSACALWCLSFCSARSLFFEFFSARSLV